MKCVLLSIFIVVAIQFLPSHESILKKPCLTQKHCSSDQCCAKIPLMMGHVCRERPTEGETCFISKEMLDGKFYIGGCPCAEGLTCEKGDSFLEKAKGTCVRDTEVEETEAPDTEDIE